MGLRRNVTRYVLPAALTTWWLRSRRARSDRGEHSHPVFARFLTVFMRLADRGPLGELRERVLADASGRVLEVGAGSGENFSRYPAAVTEVVAVEPEPYLRGVAEQMAAKAPMPVKVLDGTAGALPVGDGEFDTVVFSLVLCSVDDVGAALAEARRALRPGGRLVVLEHVRATDPKLAALQDRFAPRWRKLMGNCHVNRDLHGPLEAAGFSTEDLERFEVPPFPLTRPHVRGTAAVSAG